MKLLNIMLSHAIRVSIKNSAVGGKFAAETEAKMEANKKAMREVAEMQEVIESEYQTTLDKFNSLKQMLFPERETHK